VILPSPGSLSFADLLRPPVKAGGRADEVGLLLEGGAPRELDIFEFLDASEVAVDEGRVSQRPQVLGGLQFRGIGWQEEQVHVVGHP
jgi:hypothetical protein